MAGLNGARRIAGLCGVLFLGGCAEEAPDFVEKESDEGPALDTASEPGDNGDTSSDAVEAGSEIEPVLEPVDFDEGLTVNDALTAEELLGTYVLSTGGLRMTFETDGRFSMEKYDDKHAVWDPVTYSGDDRWSLAARRLTLEIHQLLLCIDCRQIVETYTAAAALVDDTLYWDVWHRMMTDDDNTLDGIWAAASTADTVFCPECEPPDYNREGEDRIFSLSIADDRYALTFQPFDIAVDGFHVGLPMTHNDVIEVVDKQPQWAPPAEILDALGPTLCSDVVGIDTSFSPTDENGHRVLGFPTDNIMTWERTLTFTRVQ